MTIRINAVQIIIIGVAAALAYINYKDAKKLNKEKEEILNSHKDMEDAILKSEHLDVDERVEACKYEAFLQAAIKNAKNANELCNIKNEYSDFHSKLIGDHSAEYLSAYIKTLSKKRENLFRIMASTPGMEFNRFIETIGNVSPDTLRKLDAWDIRNIADKHFSLDRRPF